MQENAGLVNHSEVQWTPVLEEREVAQFVVDGKPVVGRIVIFCRI